MSAIRRLQRNMNQIFGYQILSKDLRATNVDFEGASPVEMPLLPHTAPGQLRVFAQQNTSLQTHFCQRTGLLVYVWGIPIHPDIAQSEIPAWCLDTIAEKRYGLLKDLLGHFIVIVDDPKQRCVTFVTDILGIRPMFVGYSDGRMIFGSEVWPIQRARLIKGNVNYDALSAWLAFKYNCTNGSLFTELNRLAPGSVTVYKDGHFAAVPYVQLDSRDNRVSEEEAAEDLHGIVSSTTRVMLTQYPRVSLALSGGYDSRYLLALSSSILKQPIECATVAAYNEYKSAHEVAEATGASHRKIPVLGSEWDLYDEVFHAAPDGFPITKNLTYLVVQEYPHIPLLNGFMGEVCLRGELVWGKPGYEFEAKANLAGILFQKHLAIPFDMFQKDIAKRLEERSRIPIEEAVRQGSRIGRIITWQDLYLRRRLYIANNFIQHLGLAEALVPLYSWKLLNYKLSHDPRVLNPGVYRKIFQRYFPGLEKIPHVGDLGELKNRAAPIARVVRTWGKHLLPVLCNKNRLTLLSRQHCLPRILAGVAGVRRAEPMLFILQRLYLFEEQMKDASLDFDWECV